MKIDILHEECLDVTMLTRWSQCRRICSCLLPEMTSQAVDSVIGCVLKEISALLRHKKKFCLERVNTVQLCFVVFDSIVL